MSWQFHQIDAIGFLINVTKKAALKINAAKIIEKLF